MHAVLGALGSDRMQSERHCKGPCRTQQPSRFQDEAFVISCHVVRVEPVAAPCVVQSFRVIIQPHSTIHGKSTPDVAPVGFHRAELILERRPRSNIALATAEHWAASLTEPVHATLAKFNPTISMSDATAELLLFVRPHFTMLPTRSQQASGAPIVRQRWCSLATCPSIGEHGILWAHLG